MRRFLRPVNEGAGQPKAINPASLPGLELYLRSDLGISAADNTTMGGANGWLDQSGNARNCSVTIETPPTYHSTGPLLSPKGKPCVSFNGTTNGMHGPWPATIVASTGFTAYVVARLYATVNGFGTQTFWESQGSRPAIIANFDNPAPTNLEMLLRDDVFGFRFYGVSPLGYNDWVYNCIPPVASASGPNRGYINGVRGAASSINWNWTNPIGNYNLAYQGSTNCKMDLFALVVFSRGHDAGTVAGVRAFLRGIFG